MNIQIDTTAIGHFLYLLPHCLGPKKNIQKEEHSFCSPALYSASNMGQVDNNLSYITDKCNTTNLYKSFFWTKKSVFRRKCSSLITYLQYLHKSYGDFYRGGGIRVFGFEILAFLKEVFYPIWVPVSPRSERQLCASTDLE